MRPALRIEPERIQLTCEAAGIKDEARATGEADRKKLDEWRDRYRKLAAERFKNPAADLLELGREMYTWLDGAQGWVGRLRNALPPPLIVDLIAPANPGPALTPVLDVPWELLADDGGHLAGDPGVRFMPVRRYGEPREPAAPPPRRLSVIFMAAAPRGDDNLSYELEETAILDCAGSIGLDLTVEDSGSLELLSERMGAEGPFDALHLSCHGTTNPAPSLLLEDELGQRELTAADAFLTELPADKPRLLFLSACHTAEQKIDVPSLCAALLRAGMPAVLGWDGAVRDLDATAFATALYRRLSKKDPLESAIAEARYALLNPQVPGIQPARDWHLARLYLRPEGGGRLCAGTKPRKRFDPEYGHKAFLDPVNRQVEVASRREFVGRRRETQDILRTYREHSHPGVLIHGMGRQGKSSLAARIANRLADHKTAVVFGRYDAPAMLEALRSAYRTREVEDAIDRETERVRRDPRQLCTTLRELLEGPCNDPPMLLVVDDFERALDLDKPIGEGLFPVKPDLVPGLSAVMEGFDGAATDSCLMFTSRYRFELPGRDGRNLEGRLFRVQLPPMDQAGGRKQALQKSSARQLTLPEPERLKRCIELGQGNPGLQDLFFALALEDPKACDAALGDMEAYVVEGAPASQEKLVAFLENLVLEKLLGVVSERERELLRASTLFELPVPPAVMSAVAEAAALSGDGPIGATLLALGLWDRFADLADGSSEAVQINALVRPMVGQLSEGEAKTLAIAALPTLFAAWGGEDGSTRPYPADYQLARLAALAEDADVLAVVASHTVLWLLRHQYRYKEADALSRGAIEILNAAGRAASLDLLRLGAESAVLVGETARARDYYARAMRILEGNPAAINERTRAPILYSYATLLLRDGRVDEALELLTQAQGIYEDLGEVRERAVMLSRIAEIKAARGQVDEAFGLHEELLRVYEELGDVPMRAAALRAIADIKAQRGQVDDALELHEETLRLFEALDDVHERSVALGRIAIIKEARGQLEEAYRLYEEQLRLYEELGDVRERAMVLGYIARIKAARGNVDEALALHEQCLRVHEALGEVEGQANARWSIAVLELGKPDPDPAVVLEHLGTAYKLVMDLGKVEAISAVGIEWGQVLAAGGRIEEARQVLDRSRAGFGQLGWAQHARQVEAFLEQIGRKAE